MASADPGRLTSNGARDNVIALPLPLPARYAAVVDVGSNSLRLEIYDRSFSPPKCVHEEDEMCGIARGTSKGHRMLDSTGMKFAKATLKQFHRTIRRYRKKKGGIEVYAIGTAALRAVQKTEAGRNFLEKASRRLGYTIKVITGVKESRLTGLGILAENPDAKGSWLGIGGASMEGGVYRHGKIRQPFVIETGALTLFETSQKKGGKPILNLRKELKNTPRKKGKPLYVTGGDFRALARILYARKHKEKVSDAFPAGFSLSLKRAKRELTAIGHMKLKKLRKMPDKISERAERLRLSAQALRAIIEHIQPDRLVFSEGSIRLGLVHAGEQGYNTEEFKSFPVAAKRLSSRARQAQVHRASEPVPAFQKARYATPA